MPFSPGENVGPYRIVEQLGQGGMATVYKAYHAALDRYVAIKALHPAFMQDPQFLARFTREAQVVAKLDHAHIVPVFDFSDHGGQPYLVMKFIKGETLKAVLDRRKLGKQEILRVVRAVGQALGYAHEQGVLHRDIKPSNVLLSAEGQIYLADFGLARMAEAGQSTLSGDQLLGTPHYISPEQARGERELDKGTDIYSLGIVLYQMLVGKVPFDSDTPFSIIHDHIYTPLPMPRQLNPELPESVEHVLLKALAKDRQDRHASVADLVQAFEAALDAETAWQPVAPPQAATAIAAPAPAAEDRLVQRRAGRRRWPWVAGGLLLSFICILSFLVAVGPSLGGAAARRSDRSVAGEEPGSIAGAEAIQAARSAVDERPDDPVARMELGHVLQEAELSQAAAQEFIKAGELFLAQEAYPAAAKALLEAVEITQAGEPRAPALLSQALFLGAPTGEMLPLLEAASDIAPDRSGLIAIEARSRLYLGDTEAALVLVEGILQQDPQDLLANAVRADVLIMQDKPAEALQLVEELLSRPRLPEWLAEHLHQLRESLAARS